MRTFIPRPALHKIQAWTIALRHDRAANHAKPG